MAPAAALSGELNAGGWLIYRNLLGADHLEWTPGPTVDWRGRWLADAMPSRHSDNSVEQRTLAEPVE